MSNVKAQTLLAFLLLLAVAFLFFPPSAYGSAVFYISVTFLAIALALSSHRKGLAFGLEYLRLIPKKGRLASLLLWGLAAFLASGIITAVISMAFSYLGVLDSDLVGQKILKLPLQVLIVAFTLAPLGEEALFRGYIFRKITERSGASRAAWIPAALVSSALFAAMHISYGSVAELAVSFFVSLTFCAVTQKTKSLVPALVAHASFNLLSIVWTVLL